MLEMLQQVLITFILILCLVFLDFIFGVAVALKNSVQGARAENGGFSFKLFLDFLKKFISPYFLIWLAVSAVSILITWLAEKAGLVVPLAGIIPLSIFIDGAAGAILICLGNDIKNKAIELGLKFQGE